MPPLPHPAPPVRGRRGPRVAVVGLLMLGAVLQSPAAWAATASPSPSPSPSPSGSPTPSPSPSTSPSPTGSASPTASPRPPAPGPAGGGAPAPHVAPAPAPLPAGGPAPVVPNTAPQVAPPAPPAAVPPAVDPAAVEQARLAREAAERQVEAFRAQVEQATQVLTEGSQRLAVEQDELARVQSAQATAARRVHDAVAAAADARARLSVMIGQAYMNPVPDPVQLALTSSPVSVADAVVARADLDRVRGSSTDVLREANGTRVAADAAVRTAAQLSQQAAQKKAAVEAQVAQLRSYALQSEQALQAASVALASAQQLEQVAVADAAAAESARKARDAALAAALANRGLLATCTAQPTGTLVNGFLDPSILCPLDDAPGKALQPTAAAAFNAMNAAHKAQTGTPICVTDSYRSYAEQVQVYAEKPDLAAVPGRSNHGLGLALDLCGGVQDFGSAAHLWMKMNAGQFGWFHPAWAEPGGAKPEPWHWEYAAGDYTSVQPGT